MGISIKNAATEELIRELAMLTGETQTAAVTVAVRERIERLKRAEKPGLAERLMAIGRDCASRMTAEERAFDWDNFLYDERGLPK